MYSKFSDFNSYNMAIFDNIVWSFIIKSHFLANYTTPTKSMYITAYALAVL